MNRRPNVLVVMSDEQSWSTLACNGNSAAHTPHLDALASEATSFDRSYATFPLCCPSRASIWTGLMAGRHGVLGNWRPIVPELRDAGLARAFSDAGYHTIYTGKWHVPGTTPEEMGWADCSAIPAVVEGRDRGRYIAAYREWAERKGYRFAPGDVENLTPEDVAATTGPGSVPCASATIPLEDFLESWQTGVFLDAMGRRPRDRPWLAVCSFNAPHFPMVVPRPYDQLVDRSKVELPVSLATGPATTPREVRESRFATEFAGLTHEQWVEVIAHYLGLCALVDAQLGRIVERCKADGEWENTIVVFLSDHGDMMGAHGLMEKGHLLHYEEACRVPLLIRHPDRLPSRTENLVSLCDVAVSLAELAGVEWAQAGDGVSFAGMVGGRAATPTRQFVITESTLAGGHAGGHGEPFHAEDWTYPRDSLNAAIRCADVRYIYRSHDQDELYDLASDPHEQRNIAADAASAGRRRALRETLAGALATSFPAAANMLRDGR